MAPRRSLLGARLLHFNQPGDTVTCYCGCSSEIERLQEQLDHAVGLLRFIREPDEWGIDDRPYEDIDAFLAELS